MRTVRAIAGSPVAMSLFGLAAVLVADGTGRTPEAVCCPSCGAIVVTVFHLLAAAKARTPDAPTQQNAAAG